MARNPYRQDRHYEEAELTGVNADGSGDFTHTFSDLKHIPSKANVSADCEDGFVAHPQSISETTSGVQVTFRAYEGGGANANLAAATGDTIGNVNVSALGE